MFSSNHKLSSFLLSLYSLPILFLFAIAFASLKLDIPITTFTRDPAVIGNINPLAGIASHLGVLVLTASGAICIFSWATLQPIRSTRTFSLFLLGLGIFSLLLGLDDLFMLHESIYPRLFRVSENVILLIYGLLAIGGIVKYWKTILQTDYFIFGVALIFFALSLIVDAFPELIEAMIGQWRILFEDGFKLLGIIGWFGYSWRCSIQALKKIQTL
ncbi:hypothetical protein [Acaryochloris marina]|uniref:Uncharacterized protein n=1 Tax=Acaryochloris marina (strain MBIC 11017) TaxID=329726 RepID=B0C870_ACAM1|nr:hypothetical protein [Acaryochloris marina]ABW28890.1 conserved hypothetical protein [Acaryochloris marina MBIC11017]